MLLSHEFLRHAAIEAATEDEDVDDREAQEQAQSDLLLWNAAFDMWESMSDAQRDERIKRAVWLGA